MFVQGHLFYEFSEIVKYVSCEKILFSLVYPIRQKGFEQRKSSNVVTNKFLNT